MTLKNQIARCGAKTRKGSTCTNPPMTKGRCRLHGGATPKGIASPNFKTGKYSKFAALPAHLAERANDFLNDPHLTELRENIAVSDARMTELYAMVGTNESGTLWRLMQRSYQKYRRLEALGASKAMEAGSARTEFEKLLEEGTSQQSILGGNNGACRPPPKAFRIRIKACQRFTELHNDGRAPGLSVVNHLCHKGDG